MNVILCTKSLLLILFKLHPFVVHAFYLSRYHQVFPVSWLLGCFPSFFSSYDIPISHIYFHFFSPVLLIFVLFVPSFCHFLFSWLFILVYLLSRSFYPYNLSVFRLAFACPYLPFFTAFCSILNSCSVLITPAWLLSVTAPADAQIPHLPYCV